MGSLPNKFLDILSWRASRGSQRSFYNLKSGVIGGNFPTGIKRKFPQSFALYTAVPKAKAKSGPSSVAPPSRRSSVAPQPTSRPPAQLAGQVCSKQAKEPKENLFPQRRLAPVVNKTVRGKASTLPLSAAERDSMLTKLDDEILAASSTETFGSHLKTWQRLHKRWFSEDDAVPVFPLTPLTLKAVGAQLKAGQYRSAPNFFSSAKRYHMECGFDWSERLAWTHRDVLASTQRGIGPAHQCAELEVLAVHGLGLGMEPLVRDGPVAPGAWYMLICFHMMRGAEAAAANVQDMRISESLLTETLTLPVSKCDQQAAGVERTWGCTCPPDGTPSPCPFHAALQLRAELLRRFGDIDGNIDGDMPLFPNAQGMRCTRAAFIATVEAIVSLLGLPLVDSEGRPARGEHVGRVSGARHLARVDVQVPIIMLVARWGSNAVLRYIAEAPLTALTQVYKHKIAASLAGNCAAPSSSSSSAASPNLASVAALFSEAARELSNLKESVRLLSESHDEQTQLLACLSDEVSHAKDEVRGLRNSMAPKFVRNTTTGRIHAVRAHIRLLPPSLWRANCRWQFGSKDDVEWLASLPDGETRHLQCFRCFG